MCAPIPTTYTCTKCHWRRTTTIGDVLPAPNRYDHCPRCGSPVTSRIATPGERAFGHVLDALPLALALGAGALALDTLLKLAGKKGD